MFFTEPHRFVAKALAYRKYRNVRERQILHYNQWIDRREVPRSSQQTFSYQPLISIVMPVYNIDGRLLQKAIDSVCNQLYTNWEFCIADDCSTKRSTKKVLAQAATRDPRIKIVYREKNGHISAASNSALEMATGEFIGLLDHDDELTPDALYEVVALLNEFPETDLVYSDEDKLLPDGRRCDPHFKPKWDPDMLLAQNYVSHFGVYRRSIVQQIGGFRLGLEGSQDWDILLRFSEKTTSDRIRHIPKILYHWRIIPGSAAAGEEAKPYAYVAGRRAVQDHLDRLGVKATAEKGFGPLNRVRYAMPASEPLVSFVIATRDRKDLLSRIVGDIQNNTSYKNWEMVIVDNQSEDTETRAYLDSLKKSDKRIRVLNYDRPFNFSAIYNLGVRETSGSIVALLNNDLGVMEKDWLQELVSNALRPEVGAVGPMLVYPDETVQHAGVTLGIAGGIAGHPFRRVPILEPGYMGRVNVQRRCSAVTAACMVLRRDVFEKAGGLDEQNLPIAYNDVDLCLRIQALGFAVVYTPWSKLYHFESASRGYEDSPEKVARLEREAAFMKQKWNGALENDPFYSPNLTRADETFRFASDG